MVLTVLYLPLLLSIIWMLTVPLLLFFWRINILNKYRATQNYKKINVTNCLSIPNFLTRKNRGKQERTHDQKINRTNALSMTQDILISVMIKRQYKRALEAFDDIVEKTREINRPGRKEPRQMKPKRPYSMNYKRL